MNIKQDLDFFFVALCKLFVLWYSFCKVLMRFVENFFLIRLLHVLFCMRKLSDLNLILQLMATVIVFHLKREVFFSLICCRIRGITNFDTRQVALPP